MTTEPIKRPLTFDEAVVIYLEANKVKEGYFPDEELSERNGSVWILKTIEGAVAAISPEGTILPHERLRALCSHVYKETTQFTVNVDVPLDDIRDMIRKEGYEPTDHRVEQVCEEIQDHWFTGSWCELERVHSYIVGSIGEALDYLSENGGLEEKGGSNA